ncbi:hypothetical protein [Ichthyenterobacterium magnum]|uniref:Uncharacterized protein n=1 Tax=Ichthyenterobacterium magnum TaxID=1230530 RepID=A0A420DF84_9FLAO|nr:hypothetical protein [Ichthyenterobacterium magnum]RKE90856.1 hypothetical protein BXY80_2699 [Ichthyenterobacterium magnum]
MKKSKLKNSNNEALIIVITIISILMLYYLITEIIMSMTSELFDHMKTFLA